ncbi:tRNA (guanine(26)-N(2))-dimethyltransferase [Metallosphaera tengchongensis]|uniref:tRNA (guanine(26)-N(2))-dimethyltransferase n=1 Tax=Metallosphaera tengchongensis TaxID=1532350 RepID=A0A6N0NUD2_9CREN|nr:tRNA (guanine(26)-N(2))-dimethyltransferase [Metallosphaera tengchongensis]QKQ99368.1 tRNA (guanine(26)-N(2))-dimethyltransferase [Metallosphaera tengchongensis]
MRLIETVEGKARILLPDPSEYERDGRFDPAWSPVFYNPRMIFNRDLSVVVVSSISPKSVLDVMSATGVRGIRYYLESEVRGEIIFNDKNPVATELITKNIASNGVEKARVERSDANSLMHRVKVEYTDLDPFGTPAPFLQAAVSSLRRRGVLGVTATDLSALEGKSRNSCKRKYGAFCNKLSFSKEAGLRLLLAKIAMEASIVEKGIHPLITLYRDYYYRIFVRMEDGAKKADNTLEKIGSLYECESCGYSFMGKGFCDRVCPVCGGSLRSMYPAWIGELADVEFLGKVKELLPRFNYLENFPALFKLIGSLTSEQRYGLYYRLDVLSSKLRRNMPSMEEMIKCLGDATRTHFHLQGIKTSKEFHEVLECIKSSSHG